MVTVFAARDVDFYCTDNVITLNDLDDYSLFDNKCVQGCSRYQYHRGISSIVESFNFDCGPKKYLKPFVHSTFWMGCGLSTLFGGFLGDKLGRKFTAMILLIFYILVSIATIFAPNIECFLFLRFLTGLFQGPIFSLIYLIMVECVNKHMSLIGYLAQFCFSVGEVTAVMMGYALLYSWRHQVILFSLFLILFFLVTLCLLPESPRWLVCNERRDEAINILKWFARMNHRDEENIHFGETQKLEDRQLLLHKEKTDAKPSFLQLLKTFQGVMTLMTHILIWISVGFIYAALFYDAQNIGSNFYVASLLLASSESLVVLLYGVINRFGRKRPLQVCLIISSISCLAVPFAGALTTGSVNILIAVLAKVSATGCVSIMFLFTPETFPTVLRCSVFNVCLFFQQAAICSAPILLHYTFGPYNCNAFVIFASSGLVASLALWLYSKETARAPLMDTVQQFHKFVEFV